MFNSSLANEMTDFLKLRNEVVTKETFNQDKAVLKLIQMTVDNAHQHGKWAGICGELGADLSLTEEFINMGVDELSVSPGMILKLRQKIRSIPSES